MKHFVVFLYPALLCSSLSQAAVTIHVSEVDGDVVSTAAGVIDTSGLSLFGSARGDLTGEISGSTSIHDSVIFVGSTSAQDVYQIDATSIVFSTGGRNITHTNSGSWIGVISGGSDAIYLPEGYISNTPIQSNSTWSGESFSSMGLTVGSYVFSWGSGDSADSLTVSIGVAPEGHAARVQTATQAGYANTAPSATAAIHATTANSATNATHAATANTALEAAHAQSANSADGLSDSLCSNGQVLGKINGIWTCTNTVPRAETASTAQTAGRVNLAQSTRSLGTGLCSDGQQLVKGDIGWTCSPTVANALTADTALQTNALNPVLCSDDSLLVKKRGTWICADIKQKDKVKTSKKADHAAEADHALVADTLSPEICGNSEVLLKLNEEWQCSSVAVEIPFFTSGAAVRQRSGGGEMPLYNTPNDNSACCFLHEQRQRAQIVLPRGGVLSNLVVRPKLPPADNTLLGVEILVNGIPTLTVDHDQSASGSGQTSNSGDRFTVNPGDLISIKFTEKASLCTDNRRDQTEGLTFLTSGYGFLEDTVKDTLPLIIPYESNTDPFSWNEPSEREGLADSLRDSWWILNNEGPLSSEFIACGRYNVSFILWSTVGS